MIKNNGDFELSYATTGAIASFDENLGDGMIVEATHHLYMALEYTSGV